MPTTVGQNGASANGKARPPKGKDSIHPMPLGYWLEHRYTTETPLEALEERLHTLIQREANADAANVTCQLKDLPDMTCSACPVCEVGQDTRRSILCRLGREEERIAALILTKAKGGAGGE